MEPLCSKDVYHLSPWYSDRRSVGILFILQAFLCPSALGKWMLGLDGFWIWCNYDLSMFFWACCFLQVPRATVHCCCPWVETIQRLSLQPALGIESTSTGPLTMPIAERASRFATQVSKQQRKEEGSGLMHEAVRNELRKLCADFFCPWYKSINRILSSPISWV